MFELKTTVAKNAPTDVEDQATIKTAMTVLGHYDDTETGLSPYADTKLFHAVTDFQKDNDLKVDGVIKPDGSTQKTIKEKLGKLKPAKDAFDDFVRNRQDMIDAKFKGGDKYFHCKANYEAAKRGWVGKATGFALNVGRELYGTIKGDGPKDMLEDMKANAYGYNAAKSNKYKSAKEACAIHRPKGLDDKY